MTRAPQMYSGFPARIVKRPVQKPKRDTPKKQANGGTLSMFIPLHDRNALHYVRWQYVTLGLILANCLVFLISGGADDGTNPAKICSVLWSHSGKPDLAISRPARASLWHALDHLHLLCLSAWRLDASHRQHGLSLGLWRQYRRRDGACPLSRLLLPLRRRGSPAACSGQLGLAGAAHRSLGRNSGHYRRPI